MCCSDHVYGTFMCFLKIFRAQYSISFYFHCMNKNIQDSLLLSFHLKNNSAWFWNGIRVFFFFFNGGGGADPLDLMEDFWFFVYPYFDFYSVMGVEAVNIFILLSVDFHISCEMFWTRVRKATLNSTCHSVRWLNSGEDKGKHNFKMAHLLSRLGLCLSVHAQVFFPVF